MSSWRASPFPLPGRSVLERTVGSLLFLSLPFPPPRPLSISLSFFFPLFFFFSLMRISRSRVTALLARLRARRSRGVLRFVLASLFAGNRSVLPFFFISLIGDDRAGVDPRRVTGVDIDDLSRDPLAPFSCFQACLCGASGHRSSSPRPAARLAGNHATSPAVYFRRCLPSLVPDARPTTTVATVLR